MEYLSKKDLSKISRLLVAGRVIAAPTETAYGLLALATQAPAVARVIKIKGREVGKPIALMAADLKMVKRYFYLTGLELRLVKKFWPGPLTILLRPKIKFPRAVTGPNGLVGVRVSSQSWLCKLVKLVELPLTATSANLAGGSTLYEMGLVEKSLSDHGLKYIVQSRRLPERPTSTVLQVVKGKIKLLRVGAISPSKFKSMVE